MKLLSLFPLLLFANLLHAQEIKINKGKYADYYHMAYTLKPEMYSVNEEYGFNKGGKFEIVVKKEYFPVPAAHCKEGVTIRMPASHNEKKKRHLYELLKGKNTVDVVLELNPYVIGGDTDPRKLKLIFCRAFFRHKLNDYYGSL